MENSSKRFFCSSLGATLEFLSFFTLHTARSLLKRLNHGTSDFYDKQENNIFRSCLPTVFSSTITHAKTIKGDQNRFVIRVLHLRDNLFLVAYASNEIEIKNLETNELIDSISLEEQSNEPLMDIDFYGDESNILVGFRSEICVMVNMKRKSINPFPHYLPSPLSLVQYFKGYSYKNFITVAKSGVFRVWDQNHRCQDIAKFHPSQFLTDYHRPFSLIIELLNDDKNSLEFEKGTPQTLLAFINQGKQMKNAVILFRYFGVADSSNKATRIEIDGKLIHGLKQIQTKYLAVSLDTQLQIHDVLTGEILRTIETLQPFQFLVRANRINQEFEFDMIGEACIGYSYKNFFECGIAVTFGERMVDMHDARVQVFSELEAKRRKQPLKFDGKPNAIVSYCQVENDNGNYLIVTPREEQDTIYIYRLNLQ